MKAEELLRHIQRYSAPVLQAKWLILAIGLLVGSGMAIRAYFSPVMYRAMTVFHPESGDAGNGFSIPDPISLLMGSGAPSASDQQMIGVLKSQSISEKLVADTISWKGDSMLLADLILEETPRPFSIFSVLKNLVSPDTGYTHETKIIIASRQLMKEQTAATNENGFIDFSVGFYEPALTQIIAEKYIDYLIDYYTNQKTEKAYQNVAFFTERADSVKSELDKVAASRARIVDQEQYRIFARDQISTAELDIKLDMLKEMYIQLVASREQFIAQLKRVTPIIQVLDPPTPPFDVEKPSIIQAFVLGLFLVIFLATVWLTRKEWIPDLRVLLIKTIEGKQEEEEVS